MMREMFSWYLQIRGQLGFFQDKIRSLQERFVWLPTLEDDITNLHANPVRLEASSNASNRVRNRTNSEENMWFMNKIANPIVRLILRSPLHTWLSAALLLLTYHGRKSGREYSLPVQYAQDGNTLYIVPGTPEQKTWWRNLQCGAPVHVTLRGKTFPGNGLFLVQDADREAILKGLELYLHRFPPSAKNYHVRMQADGRLNPEDLSNAADSISMIRVELN
jgi:deazaflavin-dependent oxidoreductase (nitroreductase family)